MTETGELVKMVLHNNERSVQWLADRLHKNRDSVYYMLNDAKKFPIELYRQICQVFEREGLDYVHTILTDMTVKDHALSIGAVAGEMVTKLHRSAMSVKDEADMSLEERVQMMHTVRELMEAVRIEVEKLVEMLGGKL